MRKTRGLITWNLNENSLAKSAIKKEVKLKKKERKKDDNSRVKT